ncbi:DUF4402 domain-containing protein [Qipengyuania gaetbuli]|uniref:DUF4402 domain-containing protein n=1 Tax=Qipengyuania gaetbuli TaxID=266952 RepID=UPI001C98FFEA|nr:DUF4402 domain-containing protein [Qipengyuania gaetbuli]MBY6014531.1 DUF4402 domain-containing protein [Qipengyuania gaetbuli]
MKLPGRIAAACALALGVWSVPAAGDKPQLSVINGQGLRFGTFAVPTSGYREISPSGGVTSGGIFALDQSGVGPAQFVVQYDRGNNGRRRMDLVIELVFAAPATFAQGGLTARLSRYQIDLQGYGMVQPGQVIRVEIPNCVQRVCSRSFNLGGRIDVDRTFGGGLVEIPIFVDAVLVSSN